MNGSFAYGDYVENAAGNSAAKITQNYWEEMLGVNGKMGRVVEIWTPNSSGSMKRAGAATKISAP